jgi:hypothetical protein
VGPQAVPASRPHPSVPSHWRPLVRPLAVSLLFARSRSLSLSLSLSPPLPPPPLVSVSLPSSPSESLSPSQCVSVRPSRLLVRQPPGVVECPRHFMAHSHDFYTACLDHRNIQLSSLPHLTAVDDDDDLPSPALRRRLSRLQVLPPLPPFPLLPSLFPSPALSDSLAAAFPLCSLSLLNSRLNVMRLATPWIPRPSRLMP